MRVLIVEDDAEIAEQLVTALKRAGYRADVASDGPSGEEAAWLESYAIILLDLMLPGRSGTEVCRNWRRAGLTTPILMLTARDAVPDRVDGLDAGADDYLPKPFAMAELLARMRALLRRESARRGAVLSAGDLEVDSLAQTVQVRGQEVHLTPREYALLEALIRNPGRVLTRDAILDRVWHNEEALPNTVSFHLSSLRKKVDPEGRLIRTVHGFGYTLKSDDEDPA